MAHALFTQQDATETLRINIFNQIQKGNVKMRYDVGVVLHPNDLQCLKKITS